MGLVHNSQPCNAKITSGICSGLAYNGSSYQFNQEAEKVCGNLCVKCLTSVTSHFKQHTHARTHTRKRERERETDRQTDRQTDRDTDRQQLLFIIECQEPAVWSHYLRQEIAVQFCLMCVDREKQMLHGGPARDLFSDLSYLPINFLSAEV